MRRKTDKWLFRFYVCSLALNILVSTYSLYTMFHFDAMISLLGRRAEVTGLK